MVRAKYALVSLPQFERRVGPATRNPYFWARFAQPTGLVWAATRASRPRVQAALVQAIVTTERRGPARWCPRRATRVACGPGHSPRAIGPSCEPRSRTGRGDRAAARSARYRRITAAFAGTAPIMPPAAATRLWWRRRIEGKALSILRLAKASFTFAGGADYIAWKISRHAGVPVEFSPWERRHPILAAPLVLWRLTRQGAVR